MIAMQRHEGVLEGVPCEGRARVTDLVDQLGVTDMTIRRDVAALAARGLRTRVHRGALAITSRAAEEARS